MDPFIYKLVIIFIPGIVGRFLLGRLLFIKENDKFYFTLTAFLFGVFSYAIFDLVILARNALFNAPAGEAPFYVTAAIFDAAKINPINLPILMFVTFISLLLSIAWATLEKKRCLTRMFQKIGVTNRFPESDIWNHLFNSPELYTNPWVIVRDRENDLAYQGKLKLFSDTSTVPELLLQEVIVFENSTGAQQNSVNALYLALEHGRIEIECLPSLDATESCAIL